MDETDVIETEVRFVVSFTVNAPIDSNWDDEEVSRRIKASIETTIEAGALIDTADAEVYDLKVEPANKSPLSLERTRQLLLDALSAGHGIECNCGSDCTGTCTYAEIVAALDVLNSPL